MDNITKKWINSLKSEESYHHSLKSEGVFRLKFFLRVWRKILSVIKISNLKEISVLEAGCGGGKHLASFALHGSRVVGVDVSPEVISNGEKYFREIEERTGQKLNYNLDVADFFEYTLNEKFDIVFHNGVAEHFLDKEMRFSFLNKMFNFVRPGGYLISIVPSGIHPLRKEMKSDNLGGYCIPEIDYSPEILIYELKKLGGTKIKILPYNIFGYLLIKPTSTVSKLGKLFYYFFQLVPVELLPKKFAFKHASTLIALCSKN